jgi:DNA-binding HxlR family transcriptional regulator
MAGSTKLAQSLAFAYRYANEWGLATPFTEGREMAEEEPCAVDVTLRVIGGRWKVLILQDLFTGTRRFSEIHRAVHGITQKMLAQQLREMERHGIVNRLVYAEVPPKVEYSLTPLGKSLWPVLMAMHKWGLEQLAATGNMSANAENGPQEADSSGRE